MELWKDIPCYEGIYQASNTGRIRTCEGKTTTNARFPLRHWEQRILKQKYSKNKFGRSDARVNLWKDGIEKTWLVARLVGLTWCDGYEDGKTINHINGNSLDNRADNLEWTSLAENIRKGFEDGLYPQKGFVFIMLTHNMNLSLCQRQVSFLGAPKVISQIE